METYTFKPTAKENLESQIAEFMIAVLAAGRLINSLYLHSTRLKQWIEKQAKFNELGFNDGSHESGNFHFSFENGVLSVTPKTPYANYITSYINEMQTEKKEWKIVVLYILTLQAVLDDEEDQDNERDNNR